MHFQILVLPTLLVIVNFSVLSVAFVTSTSSTTTGFVSSPLQLNPSSSSPLQSHSSIKNKHNFVRFQKHDHQWTYSQARQSTSKKSSSYLLAKKRERSNSDSLIHNNEQNKVRILGQSNDIGKRRAGNTIIFCPI